MRSKRWIGATVVVTGATGLLGGWLVRTLLARGARVIAVVRSSKPKSQFYLEGLDRQVEIEAGSVYVHGFIRDVIQRIRPDYFFHTAYGADLNRVLVEPLECFRSSVESTWLALETIRKLGPRCVSVISSSDQAYGSQPDPAPFKEERPLTPQHPYEVCKASLDLAAQSFGKTYKLPVGITRCGSFFGPYDFNFTRLIPRVIRSVVEGQPPSIHSDDYFAREYLYVEEAAEAHLLLAERLSEDESLHGEAFNLSYGKAIDVVDIAHRIIKICGANLEPMIDNPSGVENRRLAMSTEKAKRLLDWTPRVDFQARLEQTVKWYRSYLTTTQERASAANGVAMHSD